MTTDRMTWPNLLNANRLSAPRSDARSTNGRTPFESDIDRVLFTPSFRRLAKKTQVHPLAANDHVHNRLTHSLEVARVGAALGNAVGTWLRTETNELPDEVSPTDIGSIVQAASLAHDLGNPPFGHQGENAIRAWFQSEEADFLQKLGLDDGHRLDLEHFEGNAQGFRILTQLENHLFEGGLQLTYATLAAFLKYPRLRQNDKKNSVYLSELDILNDIAENVGLLRAEEGWSRHPLVFLVEAADDICYGIIDLEDGVELGKLRIEEVFDVMTSYLEPEEISTIEASFVNPEAFRVNLARLRGALFDRLVGSALKAFKLGYDEIMSGRFQGNLFHLLPEDDPHRQIVEAAKELAIRRIYGDEKKVEIELGSSSTFASLLRVFVDAAVRCARHKQSPETTSIDWKSKLVLRLLGDHSPLVGREPRNGKWDDYHCIRRVLDFISGMTDNYATYIAHQIQGAGISGVQRP